MTVWEAILCEVAWLSCLLSGVIERVAGSAPPPVAAGGGVFTPVDGSWGIHVNGWLWLMDVCFPGVREP